MASVLQTNNLVKEYKLTKAVDQVNLHIEQGQIYGLVGQNGAGKTTLIRMITGQTSPTSGGMALFGKMDEGEMRPMRKRLGAIVEAPSFYPFLTAAENLEYYRILKGVVGKEKVGEALQTVGLADTGRKKFKQFSLGMKQRLGLALAVMDTPDFLLLDEPINGLDPVGIVEVRNILKRMNYEYGTTILISSHILSELSNIATHYGFMDHGRMIKEGTSEEILQKVRSYIEIAVDDVEAAVMALENKMYCREYEVLPENVIHIYAYLDNPSAVMKELGAEGVLIRSMTTKGGDLESYYVELIGKQQAGGR